MPGRAEGIANVESNANVERLVRVIAANWLGWEV
jgi:hypothetical protein